MKLWRFSDPQGEAFARASRSGSWEVDASGHSIRCRPMLLEWEEGSSVVGDFTWPAFDSDLVVKAEIGLALFERFNGIELGEVRIVEKPSKRGAQTNLDAMRVDLWEVWTQKTIAADKMQSTITEKPAPGEPSVSGVESIDVKWDRVKKALVKRKVDRDPASGLFVASSQIDGADIFRVQEVGGWIICTDEVRNYVLGHGYSNVQFLEVGEIV